MYSAINSYLNSYLIYFNLNLLKKDKIYKIQRKKTKKNTDHLIQLKRYYLTWMNSSSDGRWLACARASFINTTPAA